jgi:hypothetical protein
VNRTLFHGCVIASDLRGFSSDLRADFVDRSLRRVVGYATARTNEEEDRQDGDARRHPTPNHAECEGVFA